MSMLTFDAIGKHITPTRYRAIIETASLERLAPEKQAIVSQDQKHSSYVAKRCYQKQLSRTVATGGAAAIRELVGAERDVHTDALADSLRVVNPEGTSTAEPENENSVRPALTETIPTTANPTSVAPTEAATVSSPATAVVTVEDVDEPTVGVGNSTGEGSTGNKEIDSNLVVGDDIDVKKEELRNGKRFLTFTKEEDKFLRIGYSRYAKSAKRWADILNDKELQFQDGRTRDSLRVRATSLGLGKPGKKGKSR